MDSFLHQIAQHLWNRHHGHMDEVLVVFNNRRAGRFLTEELIGMDSRPFFLPRIIGIDDLINELGMLQIAPQELMLFELYDIHCQKEGPDRRFQTFEEFMSFGMMMLGDFSEIDLYMVDARSLFNTLKEHKRLGEWEPDVGDSLTPFRIAIWDYDDSFGRDGTGELKPAEHLPELDRCLLLNRLQNNPYLPYDSLLRQRYKTLRDSGIFSKTHIEHMILENDRIIKKELARNFKRWPADGHHYADAYRYEDELEVMRRYLDIHIPVLDEALGYGEE